MMMTNHPTVIYVGCLFKAIR
ncbi:hypothetical protein, partial [Escherichia coli]